MSQQKFFASTFFGLTDKLKITTGGNAVRNPAEHTFGTAFTELERCCMGI